MILCLGKKGATKKRLESETKTRITIPKQGSDDQVVVVAGDTKGSVISAYNRISLMVNNARYNKQVCQ